MQLLRPDNQLHLPHYMDTSLCQATKHACRVSNKRDYILAKARRQDKTCMTGPDSNLPAPVLPSASLILRGSAAGMTLHAQLLVLTVYKECHHSWYAVRSLLALLPNKKLRSSCNCMRAVMHSLLHNLTVLFVSLCNALGSLAIHHVTATSPATQQNAKHGLV